MTIGAEAMAKTGYGDAPGKEESPVPIETIRLAFACGIREYCGTRIPDGLAGNSSTFLGRISDPSSYEHETNFFLFCLILKLRELFHVSAAETARIGEGKLNADLAMMLATKDWSLMFLRQTAENGNIPAKLIWQTLSCLGLLPNGGTEEDTLDIVVRNPGAGKSEKDADSGREKNLSATSRTADVLFELRLRLRKGRLWKDDPWWPQPSEEGLEEDL